jgi:cyclase
MRRPRIIPVLLLKDRYLVKTTRFGKPNYIGDPINAVRIFNDLNADELVFLDIEATKQGRAIDLDFVKEVAEEANMPFSVGGGICSLKQIRDTISAGAERVIIGTHAAWNPEFIRQASDEFGSSTISVCIDYKNKFLGGTKVFIRNATEATPHFPSAFAKRMEQMGAGELIVQSVSLDGGMQGYDIPMLKEISESVSIPVVGLGGAGKEAHLREAFNQAYLSGVAAGSLFVYKGNQKGVLINYPENKKELFV